MFEGLQVLWGHNLISDHGDLGIGRGQPRILVTFKVMALDSCVNVAFASARAQLRIDCE